MPPEVPDFLDPMRIYKPVFEKEAVLTALARREEAIPHLIASIEWATKHLDDEDNEEIPDYILPLENWT